MPQDAVHRVTKVQVVDVIRYEADEEKVRHQDPMVVIYDIFPRCGVEEMVPPPVRGWSMLSRGEPRMVSVGGPIMVLPDVIAIAKVVHGGPSNGSSDQIGPGAATVGLGAGSGPRIIMVHCFRHCFPRDGGHERRKLN